MSFSSVGEPLALRRSRREKKKSRASDRLEQIRSQLNQAGPSYSHPPHVTALPCRRARETGVVEEEENLETAEGLFNYVTEEEYGEIVQQRQREGWILNDGTWEWAWLRTAVLLSFLRWLLPGTWERDI